STSNVRIFRPNLISTSSPTARSAPDFAVLPFTFTRPSSPSSLASVRLLTTRDTFRNLSNLILFTPVLQYLFQCAAFMNGLLHPAKHFFAVFLLILSLLFFAFLFLGIAPYTLQVFHCFRRCIPDYVTVPSDDFRTQTSEHIEEIEIPLFFADGTVECDLQQNIPELFNDCIIILLLYRLDDLER